jgi:hypothetical protein
LIPRLPCAEAGARGRDGTSQAGAGEGCGRAGLAPGKNRGRVGLAPGRVGAASGWRPGKGKRPSRPRPRQGVAVAETAEGAGSGGRVAGVSRERHGCVTEDGPRHREAENVTLPPVFFRRCNHVTVVLGPYRGPKRRIAFQGLDLGAQEAGKCDVLGIFVTDRVSRASLSGRTVTEVRLRVGLCPLPTNPSRPGRLVAATPCRGRHETPGTHLGRPQRSEAGPGTHLGRPQAPEAGASTRAYAYAARASV